MNKVPNESVPIPTASAVQMLAMLSQKSACKIIYLPELKLQLVETESVTIAFISFLMTNMDV